MDPIIILPHNMKILQLLLLAGGKETKELKDTGYTYLELGCFVMIRML